MVKVEQNHTINGTVVTKEFETNGIAIYLDCDSQVARVINNNNGEVVASIYLNAYTGEGGGGTLDVQEGL